MTALKKLQTQLNQLQDKNRYRSLSLGQGIDLSSNDYLGMRDHPKLREAAIEALENGLPLGAGGSRLLRGHEQAHQDLEEFAAQYYGFEKALFFANGFAAGQALFSCLPDRHDVILFDSLIHACARDGIQASPAKHIRIPHNDLNAFEEALKKIRGEGKAQNIWIAIESLYSMDGDFAPLSELYTLAREYDAFLVIDEAHASGIFGAQGKGLTEDLRPSQHLITMHTCGKALGVAGGLVCGPAVIIDALINKARGFIYSTAPMPLQAYLVQKSLEILEGEPERREQLLHLLELSKILFPGHANGSQIIPIVLGEDAKAISTAEHLQAQGYDIRAIRPPTVPEGQARLRLSLNSSLDEKTLKSFALALQEAL